MTAAAWAGLALFVGVPVIALFLIAHSDRGDRNA